MIYSMTTPKQQKDRQASYKRRQTLLEGKLLDIHSFITCKIGEYIELRKEECYQHILTFEKDINESGFSGASRKKKAQAGIKVYTTIEESLEGLRELGPTLAQEMPKTKPDYTKILSTQMKDGGKLSDNPSERVGPHVRWERIDNQCQDG